MICRVCSPFHKRHEFELFFRQSIQSRLKIEIQRLYTTVRSSKVFPDAAIPGCHKAQMTCTNSKHNNQPQPTQRHKPRFREARLRAPFVRLQRQHCCTNLNQTRKIQPQRLTISFARVTVPGWQQWQYQGLDRTDVTSATP